MQMCMMSAEGLHADGKNVIYRISSIITRPRLECALEYKSAKAI